MKGIFQQQFAKLLFKILIAAFIVSGIIFLPKVLFQKEEQKEIVTALTLEKIINVSKLSTFTAVYNGVAQVFNEQTPTEIDFYVSYESKVNAGIDFEKINIAVNQEQKTIHITLPEVYITDINVDVASLDYIFLNNKANTSTVSEIAFKACEQDAKAESEKEQAIFELATQNAKNIVTALTKPIIEQLDAEYTLIVE